MWFLRGKDILAQKLVPGLWVGNWFVRTVLFLGGRWGGGEGELREKTMV